MASQSKKRKHNMSRDEILMQMVDYLKSSDNMYSVSTRVRLTISEYDVRK